MSLIIDFIQFDEFKIKFGSIGNDLNKKTTSFFNSIILVMPYIDYNQAVNASKILNKRTKIDAYLICVEDINRVGFIHIVNHLFKNTKSDYFGYLAQDIFPGRNWLDIAMENFKDDSCGLFSFNDGKWGGLLASYGLVKRDWAIKNYDGFLFYNQYKQHYADVELTLLAMSDKKYCYNANAVLLEIDPEKDNKKVNIDDKILFNKRKIDGFNGKIKSKKLINIFS